MLNRRNYVIAAIDTGYQEESNCVSVTLKGLKLNVLNTFCITHQKSLFNKVNELIQ